MKSKNNLIQAHQYIKKSLCQLFGDSEIRNLELLILEKLTGFSRTQILTSKNSILSAEQTEKLQTIVLALQKQEPIQYIFGETEFYSLPFFVDKNVLIPRPETEELVDWILQDCGDANSILDIGTGSGCIAVALAKHLPKAQINALDISENVLALAERNARRNGLTINFLLEDILTRSKHEKQYDLIVSNPPYICEREKVDIDSNVLDYEPHVALFVPDSDPLLFYKHIALFGRENLVSGGKLFFEINRAYGKETVEMLQNLGYSDIKLRKDLSGNDRMIKAVFE